MRSSKSNLTMQIKFAHLSFARPTSAVLRWSAYLRRYMLMKLIILLFFLPLYVSAGELPDSECEKWRMENKGVPKISVNDFTKENAQKALKEINSLVSDSTGEFNFPNTSYRKSEAMIKGYLLRKELIDARRNREHDADEMIAFCIHWASVAYEK